MIWIGTSGWVYQHWVGRFYPPDLPEQDWLAYYASQFSTVEINRSFYRLPDFEQFRAWKEQTAAHPGFLFAVKASRYLTHMKKLKEPHDALQRLLKAAQGLGEQIGPFLYQLPPHWRANPERLEAFLAQLPPGQQAALEVRDASWYQPEMLLRLRDILEKAGCALVISIGGELPTPTEMQPIGPFRYLRIHHGQHGVGLSNEELSFWAKRIHNDARQNVTAYVYFNNDPDGHAVNDARRLRRLLETEEKRGASPRNVS